MKKATTVAIAVVILLILTQAVQAQPPEQKGPPPRVLLKQADKNQDGKVTFDEAKTIRPNMTQERFNALDRNKDGVLTKDDRPPQARPGPGGQARPLARLLQDADKDKDGKVTFDELKAVAPNMTQERFTKLDKNGDGVITKDDKPAGS